MSSQHPNPLSTHSLSPAIINPEWTQFTPLLSGMVGVLIGLLIGNAWGWL